MKKLILFVLLISQNSWALPLEGITALDGTAPNISHGKDKELVLFWATWCATCKEKMKTILPEISSKHNVGLVTVNIDKNLKRAQDYVHKYEIQLPVLRDESEKLVKGLHVVTAPHWALYKKTGTTWELVHSEQAFDREKIEKLIETN